MAIEPRSSYCCVGGLTAVMDSEFKLLSSTRLASREDAARYCRLSKSTFSSWVRSGRLPRPLPGTARWDLKALDLALDSLSGIEQHSPTLALDEWRTKRARRSQRNS